MLAVFVMGVILMVALTAATIMIYEIRMSREIANSVSAFFASDAAAEQCLYQTRKQAGSTCASVGGEILITLDNGAIGQAKRASDNKIAASGIFGGTKRSVELTGTGLVATPPTPPTIVTFGYTGGQQTWTVPPGVTSINADVIGAQGCGATKGGKGGRVLATLSVTPNSTLYIYVGGVGGNDTCSSRDGGWNGGGPGGLAWYSGSAGGGASDIRQGGNRIIVAGGGGGEGAVGTAGGAGGAGALLSDISGIPGYFALGANGGGDCGNGGGGGLWTACISCCTGACGFNNGACGSLGQGGGGWSLGFIPDTPQGWCFNRAGGGGGGGYYGGGGGGGGEDGVCNAGGGGGGSSWAISTATGITFTGNYQSGNGQIAITY